MTSDDKKLIADYMEWCDHKYAKSGKYWGTGICTKCKSPLPKEHNFDLNDARMCVEKMVENGDWIKFVYCAANDSLIGFHPYQENFYSVDLISRLFKPDNFFSAMAAWLKEK